MAGAAWYRYNTVTVTQGSASVVGVQTSFLSQVSIGDLFTVDGTKIYEILSVVDDTHITLQTVYTGATGSTAYGILRNFTTTTNAALAAQLTALLGSWQTREDQQRIWLAGALLSGYRSDGTPANPAGNDPLAGYYPMSDAVGVTRYIPCPALFTNATKLGGFVASQTPGANQILVTSATGSVEFNAVAGQHLMLKLNAATDKYSQLGFYEEGALKWNIFNDYANDSLAFGTSAGAKAVLSVGGNLSVGYTADSGARIHSQVANIGDSTLCLTRAGSSRFNFVQGIAGVTGDALILRDTTLGRDYLTLRSGNILVGTQTELSTTTKLQVYGSTGISLGAAGVGLAGGATKGEIYGINTAFSTYNALGFRCQSSPQLFLNTAGEVLVNTDVSNGSGAKLQVNGSLTAVGTVSNNTVGNAVVGNFYQTNISTNAAGTVGLRIGYDSVSGMGVFGAYGEVNAGLAFYTKDAGNNSLKMSLLANGGLNITTQTFASESAAITGGLIAGTIYKTVTGELRIKL